MQKTDFSKLDDLVMELAQVDYWKKRQKVLLQELSDLTQEDLRVSAQLKKETEEYERLERLSFKNLILRLRKDYEEAKNKEYQDMQIATYKHQALLEDIENVRAELEQAQAQLERLRHVKSDYDALLQSKLQWASQIDAQTLSGFESKIYALKKHLKETDEALHALDALKLSLKSAEEGLSSAKNWGIFDIVGGGMLSSLIKHDNIERAAGYLKDASQKAQALNRELLDIDLVIDMDGIDIDGFTKTFDIFFDNIFSDLAVQDEIHKAYDNIMIHQSKMNVLEDKLLTLKKETTDALDQVVGERDAYVCSL